ncbi:MAG: autotransporter outer membrane beta-barrel domain-containing protein [Pseudomonadota bacterium]|nr:autotransporter outer membrane beta-barrel domain-containing protein [Pseudomonadota bacterium]
MERTSRHTIVIRDEFDFAQIVIVIWTGVFTMHRKTQLALGVATAAIATGFATPANAACTVDGNTVTCTADSTAAEVNTALASVAGEDANLEIVTDASVVQPNDRVQPTQQGAIAIDNAGDVGTEAAPVGIFYVGTATDAANSFELVNRGAITGPVNVQSVGGAVDIANSGLLAEGVFVNVQGPATLVSDGRIDSSSSQAVYLASRTSADTVLNGDVGTAATATTDSDLRDVFVQSQFFQSTPTTSETETVDGVTTTTTTSGFTRIGGTGSATVGEGANTGSIGVFALDGATVSVDGSVGSETEFDSVSASSNTQEGSTITVSQSDGTDSSFVRTSTQTAIGASASVSIGETGSVSGSVNASGLESADVDVDGTVGNEAFFASVSANSQNTDFQSTSANSTTGTVSTSSFEQTSSSVGGTASVSVSETGSVTGGISANGFAAADISIDGSVGTAANPSFVSASSNGSDNTFAQDSTFDSDTGANDFAQLSTNSSTGSDASIEIGETGVVNGSVNSFANGDAAVVNAGTVSGSAFATADGTDSANGSSSVFDGAGNSEFANFSTSEGTGGTAAIENAAGGLIGLDATAPVTVQANGDAAASVSNAGRINGNVGAFAGAFSSESANSGSFASETDAATGVVTSVSENARANSSTNLGGDAGFANSEGGLVTGSVDVSGTGSADVSNEGAVIGRTFASSRATDSAFLETIVTTTVTVPGADGGTTSTRELQRNQSNVSSGGDVTGIYAGTNGAVQFAPFGGASDGSVFQSANGNSSAIVTGSIFGNFNGDATGSEFASSFSDSQTSTFDADGDFRSFDREYLYDESNRQAESDSSLIVDGGRITGSASVYATSSANIQIAAGGAVDGNLNATAQGFGGYDYSETYDLAQTFDEDGGFVGSELFRTFASGEIANGGDVSVAITDGTVGGSVFTNGAGGINSFVLGADSSVGGVVSQRSQYSTRGYEQTFSSTSTATGSTTSNDYLETLTASGGDVTAMVAGTIGVGDMDPLGYGDVANAGGSSLSLSTNAGDAAATVSGQVRNGISVIASGADTTFAFQEEREDGLRTSYSQQRTSARTGGTATLTVDAANADIPAIFGNITVFGLEGSSATIGANSSVLAATNGASMQVGTYFFDTVSTREDEYTNGVLTGQTTTFERSGTGGAATLTNSGRIGYDGGAAFDGTSAFAEVYSTTAATAVNNGQIFGSIGVFSLYEDISSTTTRTDLDDVTRTDTTTTTYAATGGTATLTNNGLVTGNASLAALDGTLVNNGVLRGDVSLGQSVNNYTTRSTDTLTQLGEEEVFDLAEAIEQGYAVEQNGLLGGTISVAGVFGAIDDTIRTSGITAGIALNSGSVTGGGVTAEYDEETGERFTNTTVTLNGSGYLGLGDTALAQLEDSFGNTDPGIAAAGDLSAFAGGARVLGVQSLTKAGNGMFLITGAAFAPRSNTNTIADYTLDVGTFAINAGEIQLATVGSDSVFGIRGNAVNAASLVLGSRVELPAPLFGTNSSVTAIDGVEVYQNGNFTQTGTGSLSVGVTPTLVRVSDPRFSSNSTSTNPLAFQSIGLASGLFTTPENAFGQAFANLGTSFLTVDGNMNLAGTVRLVSPTGGIFTDGQRVDIASVSGTVTTSANVAVNSPSNFVTFDLGTRTEGGRTIVFASADRVGFETAGNNQNAIAAGTALSAAFPDVIATIRAGSAGGIGLGGDQFVLAQDLANIFVGFDSLLTMDQVSTALNELASGEFYGSLTALETTAPFVDAISSRRVPAGASGFNVWIAPSGDFVELEGDTNVGSRDFEADNYGASAGFGVSTGRGEIGLGFGYGRISANSDSNLLTAEADTWMVGAYLRQAFGNFAIGADLVYGWSDWNATRIMPTLSRTALADFDSTELRGSLRAEYMVDFGGGWVAPFGQLSFRQFDFDGFTEEGAGAVSLVVEEADESVLTPTLGLRAGTAFTTGLATLRPEVTIAYSFDDDDNSFRDVAFLGAPTNSFRLQGVDPDGYFTIGAGLFADIGTNSGAFLRGSYATGGNVDVASVNAGVTIGF